MGKNYLGIENWAAAIFVSSSIAYSSHLAYSERVWSENSKWCCLIKVYCAKGCYKSFDSTVLAYDPIEGEPHKPELRIETDDDNIYRIEKTKNVIVYSVLFVKESFLESIKDNRLDYSAVQSVLLNTDN